jgi:hypothetical protein
LGERANHLRVDSNRLRLSSRERSFFSFRVNVRRWRRATRLFFKARAPLGVVFIMTHLKKCLFFVGLFGKNPKFPLLSVFCRETVDRGLRFLQEEILRARFMVL